MKTKLIAILTAMTMVFAMAPLTLGVAFADDEDTDAARVEAAETVGSDVEFPELDVAEPEATEDAVEYETKGLPTGCVMTVGKKKIKSTTAKGKGWTFKYKKGTGYLTLNKAKITKPGVVETDYYGGTYNFGIYAEGMKLKITLKGKNKITIKDDYSFAIACTDNLTITGKGSLTDSAEYCGIICGGTLSFSKTTVSVKGRSDYGIYADKVTMNNSKVTAIGGDDGIDTESGDGYGPLTIKNSKVIVKGGSGGVDAGVITLTKTSKGKYSTRLDATTKDTGDSAVFADIINARILTPKGGKYEEHYSFGVYYSVVDKDGNPAEHVVLAPKKANTLSVKGKTATVQYSLLQTEDQTLTVDQVIKFVKKGNGTKTYAKVSGNENILVDETTGAVIVTAGLAKGTYKVKIKVTAAGNDTYKAASKTVTATINVK